MSITNLLNEKQIATVEAYYNATYVCDTCLKNKAGGWANIPVALFYTEKKHPEGSNYFGLYYDINGRAMITDGISGTEEFVGYILIDDTIAYSRYRNDLRTYFVEGKSVWVDGGRDYLRTGGDMTIVKTRATFKVQKDKLEIIREYNYGY